MDHDVVQTEEDSKQQSSVIKGSSRSQDCFCSIAHRTSCPTNLSSNKSLSCSDFCQLLWKGWGNCPTLNVKLESWSNAKLQQACNWHPTSLKSCLCDLLLCSEKVSNWQQINSRYYVNVAPGIEVPYIPALQCPHPCSQWVSPYIHSCPLSHALAERNTYRKHAKNLDSGFWSLHAFLNLFFHHFFI
jgi:hypothetical protein